MSKPKAFNNDICCCCGEYVPEGCQVCHECEKKTENRFKVSETLMIGVDIGQGDDISVLQVTRIRNGKQEVLNTMYGMEAEWTYQHLLMNRHHRVHFDDFITMIKANPALAKCYKPEYFSKPAGSESGVAQHHDGLKTRSVIIDEFVTKEKEEKL